MPSPRIDMAPSRSLSPKNWYPNGATTHATSVIYQQGSKYRASATFATTVAVLAMKSGHRAEVVQYGVHHVVAVSGGWTWTK
jgi:hypothetical protein